MTEVTMAFVKANVDAQRSAKAPEIWMAYKFPQTQGNPMIALPYDYFLIAWENVRKSFMPEFRPC